MRVSHFSQTDSGPINILIVLRLDILVYFFKVIILINVVLYFSILQIHFSFESKVVFILNFVQ